MAELRRLGIYVLPDDTELIAVADGRGGHLLYTLADWKLYPHAPAAYEVYALGELHRQGKPTAWRVEDLIDTGRTAQWRVRNASP
jgi:hypothetical protein